MMKPQVQLKPDSHRPQSPPALYLLTDSATMVKVYKCLISGDELVSDAFKILEVKDAEGNVVRDGVGAEMAKSRV